MPDPIVTLDRVDQERVRVVAERVAAKYREGAVATMKFKAKRGIGAVNLHGFGAELAVANLLGLPWNEGDPDKPDVGHNVEVRQSEYPDGHMLMYDYDHGERIFVLATGELPSYTIRGYQQGRRVMVPAYRVLKGEVSPAGVVALYSGWWVPQEVLKPIPDAWIAVLQRVLKVTGGELIGGTV